MNLNEKLDNTIKKIDGLLEEEVKVFFINIIDENILIRNQLLPSITLKKSELNLDTLKNKIEFLMGTEVKNIKDCNVIGKERYYIFDFVDRNILNSYSYIPLVELDDLELLKKIKDSLD